MLCPQQRGHRIRRDLIAVREVEFAGHFRRACISPQDRGQLLAGHGVVAVELSVGVACDDAAVHGPGGCLAEPAVDLHFVYGGLTRCVVQDLDDLASRRGAERAEDAFRRASHQALVDGFLHVIIEPVVQADVDEIDGRVAGDGLGVHNQRGEQDARGTAGRRVARVGDAELGAVHDRVVADQHIFFVFVAGDFTVQTLYDRVVPGAVHTVPGAVHLDAHPHVQLGVTADACHAGIQEHRDAETVADHLKASGVAVAHRAVDAFVACQGLQRPVRRIADRGEVGRSVVFVVGREPLVQVCDLFSRAGSCRNLRDNRVYRRVSLLDAGFDSTCCRVLRDAHGEALVVDEGHEEEGRLLAVHRYGEHAQLDGTVQPEYFGMVELECTERCDAVALQLGQVRVERRVVALLQLRNVHAIERSVADHVAGLQVRIVDLRIARADAYGVEVGVAECGLVDLAVAVVQVDRLVVLADQNFVDRCWRDVRVFCRQRPGIVFRKEAADGVTRRASGQLGVGRAEDAVGIRDRQFIAHDGRRVFIGNGVFDEDLVEVRHILRQFGALAPGPVFRILGVGADAFVRRGEDVGGAFFGDLFGAATAASSAATAATAAAGLDGQGAHPHRGFNFNQCIIRIRSRRFDMGFQFEFEFAHGVSVRRCAHPHGCNLELVSAEQRAGIGVERIDVNCAALRDRSVLGADNDLICGCSNRDQDRSFHGGIFVRIVAFDFPEDFIRACVGSFRQVRTIRSRIACRAVNDRTVLPGPAARQKFVLGAVVGQRAIRRARWLCRPSCRAFSNLEGTIGESDAGIVIAYCSAGNDDLIGACDSRVDCA